MSQKQLLFLYSRVPWTFGAGMLSLLPVHTARLGASPAAAARSSASSC